MWHLGHSQRGPLRAPQALSIYPLNGGPDGRQQSASVMMPVALPVLNWAANPAQFWALGGDLFVTIFRVCPIGSLRKKLEFYHVIYAV